MDCSISGHEHIAGCCENGNDISGYKTREISCLGEGLLASRKGRYSVKLVTCLVAFYVLTKMLVTGQESKA